MSLKDIFNMLDDDNDKYITKAEFKSAFKKANITISESILHETYLRFDINKDEKISFNEFLTVIFNQST